MKVIATERLLIRNFRPDDAPALRALVLQYEASEHAAFDHEWPTGENDIKDVTEWFASGDAFLAVCLQETEQFIGFVALNREGEDSRELNLGYIFNAVYHLRGYALEACRAVVDYGFSDLGARRVVTGTAAANGRSWRLLEKLGLRKTGESVGSLRNGPDGKPIEFVGWTYALTKDQWQASRARS